MNQLCLAIQFLTIFPTPTCHYRERDFAQSVYFYPLVGSMIGLVLWLLTIVLPAHTTAINAALVFMAWVLITGGLHWDGLADMADAWVGSRDKEKILAIMKDPTSGPIAIMTLICISAVMILAIVSLQEQQKNPLWLFSVPVIARTMILAQLKLTPYAKPQGYGATIRQTLNLFSVFVIIVAVTSLSIVAFGPIVLTFWVAALLVVLGIHFSSKKRINGLTGDVIGASIVLQEAAILVAMALLPVSTEAIQAL